MTNLEKISLWQVMFTGATFLAAVFAAFFAYLIGKKQNEINEKALSITNFVEIFLMPSYTEIRDKEGKVLEIKWSVLIKNASSYPIYLNSFSLNGIKHNIGSNAIPNNPDSWYGVPIPKDVQEKKELSLLVSFEDYLGKQYQSEGFGDFDGVTWQIKSKKRIEAC